MEWASNEMAKFCSMYDCELSDTESIDDIATVESAQEESINKEGYAESATDCSA
jgi:hypothetical protein